jgi:hypothetical protein
MNTSSRTHTAAALLAIFGIAPAALPGLMGPDPGPMAETLEPLEVGSFTVADGAVSVQVGKAAQAACHVVKAVLAAPFAASDARPMQPGEVRTAVFSMTATASSGRVLGTSVQARSWSAAPYAGDPDALAIVATPPAGEVLRIDLQVTLYDGLGQATASEEATTYYVPAPSPCLPACPAGTCLTGGISGEITVPPYIINGQRFHVRLTVTLDHPEQGALLRITASLKELGGGDCNLIRFNTSGASPVGENLFWVAPDPFALGADGRPLEDAVLLKTNEVTLTYDYEAASVGRCRFGFEVDDYLTNTTSSLPDWIPVDDAWIVPDISLDPIDLGHIQTYGGQTRTDQAHVVAPPDRTELTVITPSNRTLAVVSATISHTDGWSYKDWGEFVVSPDADLGLIARLLPSVPTDLLPVTTTWRTSLADETDATPWYTIVGIHASEKGTANDVCLKGTYVDSGTHKGSAQSCVKVTGIQKPIASLSFLDPEVQQVVKAMLERLPVVLVPTEPGVYWAVEALAP